MVDPVMVARLEAMRLDPYAVELKNKTYSYKSIIEDLTPKVYADQEKLAALQARLSLLTAQQEEVKTKYYTLFNDRIQAGKSTTEMLDDYDIRQVSDEIINIESQISALPSAISELQASLLAKNEALTTAWMEVLVVRNELATVMQSHIDGTWVPPPDPPPPPPEEPPP